MNYSMKIIQINSFYNSGSTGKITYCIHEGLQQKGCESIIIFGRGTDSNENNIIRISTNFRSKLNNLFSRFTGIMYGGNALSTRKLINIIKEEKPDIVHLQCINGYFVNIYKLVAWLNKNSIKTVVTLHAEFMFTANCGHSYECNQWIDGCVKCDKFKYHTNSIFFDNTKKSYAMMKKSFEGFEKNCTIVSVSDWLKNRASRSSILENFNHKVIYNGLDERIFNYKTDDYTKQNVKTVLHVTPLFDIEDSNPKGSKYIVELAKEFPDVSFVVIGKHNNIRDLPNNIKIIGKVQNQQILAKYYRSADLVVLTSKRETFSMVCAESLCCGTPVVGFKAGAPEEIAINEYSSFVDYGDLDKLKYKVEKFLFDLSFDKKLISESAIKIYSMNEMNNKYYDLYQKIKEQN